MDTVDTLKNIGLLPVLDISDPSVVMPSVDALLSSGISAVEIICRSQQSLECLEQVRLYMPEMLVGASTVITREYAKQAIDIGCDFIVTPGLDPSIIDVCRTSGVTPIPGVATPTEAQTALSMGLSTLRFFPARENGGVEKLRAISKVYPSLSFIPAGGIDTKDFMDYMRLPCVSAVAGSWLCRRELISDGDYDAITNCCKSAISELLDLKIDHIGINCVNTHEASNAAAIVGMLFDTPSSCYHSFHLIQSPTHGRCGHIALSTHFLNRTVYYLEKRGVQISGEPFVSDEGHRTVFLDQDVAGFALQLIELG